MTPPDNKPRLPEPEASDLFDYALLRDYATYVLASCRRHVWLGAMLLSFVVGGAVLALWALPKTYHAHSILQAQRNQWLAVLTNPYQPRWADLDAPTRAAWQTVMRRDNLVLMVKQTDLVEHWKATRAPVTRLKDAVRELLKGPASEEEQLELLIWLLENRLKVTTNEGLVTIEVEWHEPQMAARLVETAQQNFLEARHAMEVSTIMEAISILESRVSDLDGEVEDALEELRAVRAQATAKLLDEERAKRKAELASAPSVTPASSKKKRRTREDSRVSEIRSLLSSKRRAIADLEQYRQRRLAELRAQAVEQQGMYGPSHPALAATQESISLLSGESPQLRELRREERQLEQELARRGGRDREREAAAMSDGSEATAMAGALEPPPLEIPRERPERLRDDEDLEAAEEKYRILVDRRQFILDRIYGTRIELDTTRAAFKYRYSVMKPAEVPKEPFKPRVSMVLGAGVVSGLLLAVFGAIIADLGRGRIVAPWQLERILDLRVLGEVRSG